MPWLSILIVPLWFLVLCGLGAPLAKKWEGSPLSQGLVAFLLGSILSALAHFAIVHTGHATPTWIYGLNAIFLLIALSQFSWLRARLSILSATLYTLLRGDGAPIPETRWRTHRLWWICGGIMLLWLVLLCVTPARSGDAMRYHLAQLDDILRHQSFIFRPYYCYNFPLSSSLLFLPLYMLFGPTALKISIMLYFLIALGFVALLGRRLSLHYPWIAIFLLALLPLSYQEATIITNDWVVIAYVLLGVWLISDRGTEPWQSTRSGQGQGQGQGSTTTRSVSSEGQNQSSVDSDALGKSTVILGFLSLGMALACKHQAVLFVPWFALLAWWRLDQHNFRTRSTWVILGGISMFLVPMPYYIRTFFDTGAPMWPLMQKLFIKDFQYLHEVGAHYTKDFQGKHNLANLIHSIKTIIKTPFMPASLWLLAGVGIVFARERRLRLWIGAPLFFGTLWIVQPKIYWRFPIYFTPFAALLAALGYQAIKTRAKGRTQSVSNDTADEVSQAASANEVSMIASASNRDTKDHTAAASQGSSHLLWTLLRYGILLGVGVTCLFGVGIAALYSKGLLAYHLHRDLDRYHRATWYYDDYQKILKQTSKDAKLFVIVYAGQTYYLKRSYLRGDPVLSAAIDWRKINTASAFHRFLREKKIDYLFYDRDATWHFALAGKEMKKVMTEVQRSPLFEVLWRREGTITLSRIRGTLRKTHTMLIRVKKGLSQSTKATGGLKTKAKVVGNPPHPAHPVKARTDIGKESTSKAAANKIKPTAHSKKTPALPLQPRSPKETTPKP